MAAERGVKRSRSSAKKASDRERDKTRVNIGAAFPRWRAVRAAAGLQLDSELALLLLRAYEETLSRRLPPEVSDTEQLSPSARLDTKPKTDNHPIHAAEEQRAPDDFQLPAEPQRLLEDEDIIGSRASIAYEESVRQLAALVQLPVKRCPHVPQTGPLCHSPGPFHCSVQQRCTAFVVQWVCPLGHIVWSWTSQPSFKSGMSAGDFLLGANILLSGNSYAKVSLLFRFMNMGVVPPLAFAKIRDACSKDGVRDACREGGVRDTYREGGVRETCREVRVRDACREEGVRDACREDVVRDACSEDGVRDACREVRVRDACREDGVRDTCREDGVRDTCSEGGVRDACREVRVRDACMEDGVRDACREDGVRDACREVGVRDTCREDGVRDTCRQDRVRDACREDGVRDACSEGGVRDAWMQRIAAAVRRHNSNNKESVPALPPDVQKVIVGEEEQQECSSSVDQQEPEPPPHIKEEQEELWSSQEGEQLQGLEEADITKFPFTPVPVKSEDDEEKAQSSQLHQRQTQHMETEADGEDCGGPEPARNSHPLLQPETEDQTGDSSDPETDDSADWKETREPQSALMSPKRNVGDINCISGAKPFCKKRFRYSGDDGRHTRIHTGKKMFRHSISDTINNIPTGSEPAGNVDPQSYSQPDADDKRSELKTESREPPSGSNSDDVQKETLQLHTSEKTFKCSFCDRRFTLKRRMTLHMSVHTEEKSLSCRLPWYTQQKTHDCVGESPRSRKAPAEESFSCSECGKTFSLKGNLKTHMRIHTGEKPFGCSVCGKGFKQKVHLTEHMTIHTGEKLFKCSVCGKGFNRKSLVKYHQCV
ncbi:uncharacterized protein LOC144528554 isoform X1 [Sander vitreus]